jgi:hypothetical protein
MLLPSSLTHGELEIYKPGPGPTDLSSANALVMAEEGFPLLS